MIEKPRSSRMSHVSPYEKTHLPRKTSGRLEDASLCTIFAAAGQPLGFLETIWELKNSSRWKRYEDRVHMYFDRKQAVIMVAEVCFSFYFQSQFSMFRAEIGTIALPMDGKKRPKSSPLDSLALHRVDLTASFPLLHLSGRSGAFGRLQIVFPEYDPLLRERATLGSRQRC